MNNFIQSIFNDNNSKAVILCGLPGAGKSTLANTFHQQNFFVIGKDDIRYQFACRKYGYQPHTWFKPEQLHEFSKLTHITNELICYAYKLYMKEYTTSDILEKSHTRFFRGYHNKDNQDLIFDVVKHYILDFTQNNLNQGIVFDATYLTEKSRRSIVQNLKNFHKYCIFFSMPLPMAYQRVQNRAHTIISTYQNKPVYGHFVPLEAMKRMEATIKLPTMQEGFDSIYINKYQSLQDKSEQVKDFLNHFTCNQYNHDLAMDLFPSFKQTNNVSQHTEHHYYTMDWHMMHVAEYIQKFSDDKVLLLSAILHDVGKFDAKHFYIKLNQDWNKFKKGKRFVIKQILPDKYFVQDTFNSNRYYIDKEYTNFDMNAHYYGHQYTSAIKAYNDLVAIHIDEEIAQKVYWYIFYHMYIPFHNNISYKEIMELDRHFTREEINNLLLFRQADMYAQSIFRNTDKFHADFQSNEMYNMDRKLIDNLFTNMKEKKSYQQNKQQLIHAFHNQ